MIKKARRPLGLALCLVVLIVLAACSGPSGSSDDPTATALPEPTATSPAPTATLPPTQTPEQPTPTGTATSEPTATATSEPTVTATTAPPTATPSPTQQAMPSDGAELSIVGKAVERIIPAGESRETLYAVTNAGLSRSNDGGGTWVAAGDVQPGTIIATFGNPDVLFSGDRAGCGRGFTETDFRRSEDGGSNWSVIQDSHGYEPLLAEEADGTSTLFGTECGLSISTDLGDTWTSLSESVQELAGQSVFDVHFNGEQLHVTIASEGGSGQLVSLSGSGPDSFAMDTSLADYWGAGYVDRHDDGRIALATASGVGVSDDGGQTWTWSRDGLEETTYSVDPSEEAIPEDELDAGYQLTDLAIDPTNPDRIWVAGSHGAYLSDDGGQSWQRVGGASKVQSLVISPFAERVFVSSDGSTRVWGLTGPEG